jgi:predicted AlkP superfamily phosphohydrolase/phosphomutase
MSPRKALLIGIDSAVGARWRRFAESGLLPVGQRLLDDGCLAVNCLPPLPTLTTTNWTTISTGAWPGTHGITDFNVHRPGDDFSACPQGFDSGHCRAEFIWEAAERGGRRAVVVNYPGSWPPRTVGPNSPVIVGGAGIELNEWRIGLPAKGRRVAIAGEQLFSTEEEPKATRVRLARPGEPIKLAFSYLDAAEPVAPGFVLACRLKRDRGGWLAAFTASADGERGAGEPLAELRAGEWSRRLVRAFTVGGKQVDAGFRIKVLALEPEAGLFRLFVSDICRLTWLEQPAGVLGDVSSFAGLPIAGSGWMWFQLGSIDVATLVELTAMSTEWLRDVCVRLLREREWDLFCMHFHAVDSFYHLLLHKLDPAQTPDAEERRRCELAELAVYRNIDAAIGTMLETAGEESVVALVSDHGATPATRLVPLPQLLIDAGLLSLQEGAVLPRNARGHTYADPIPGIEWERTLAVPYGSCHVYVNLEGREPYGAVGAQDYDTVRERVIDLMLAYRDPQTGLCPFSVVLRKEDARVLGLYGDAVGDVVYAVREEFSDEHGQSLGTGEWGSGVGSLKSLLLLSGPGVRRGAVLERTISLTDVAPTICHLAGLPVPLQAEGAVIYQALEDDVLKNGVSVDGEPVQAQKSSASRS